MLEAYLPQPADLVKLAATWGVGVVLAFAGSGLVGRRVAVEYRLLAGWGALCLLLTVWGVLLPASLRYPAVAFVIAAAASQLTARGRLQLADWRSLGRMLLLTLPLWVIMMPIRPSQPDTFLNLLPNAVYLVDHGILPTAASPPSFSLLPAAPYNVQFLTFLGALVDPGYPAAGFSFVNVLLELAAGLAIGRWLAGPALSADAPLSWALTALGFLAATLLNPGFVPRFNFSAYGETALMVTALFAASLLVTAQGELVAGRRPAQLLPLGLILAAMVNAKQSGAGLVAALLGAALVAGWAERATPRPALLRALAIAGLPAVLLFGLWRYYVAGAGVAELTELPPGAWNWGILPETAASAARVIGEKGVYFGCVAIALASLPVLLRRHGWSATTRLLVLYAAAFVFYNLYLTAAYVVHFSPLMTEEAHSFFRYNTHLALVLVLALAAVLREGVGDAGIARRYRRPAGVAVIAIALLTPIAFFYRLRFDLVMPQPLVWQLANEVKPYVKDGDRLALLLPGDNGSVNAMLAGVLRDVPPRRRLDLLYRPSADPAALAEAARLGYPLALISCTQGDAAVLLEDGPQGWHQRAIWHYPAAARRHHWQSILAWPPLCRER